MVWLLIVGTPENNIFNSQKNIIDLCKKAYRHDHPMIVAFNKKLITFERENA